MHGIALLDVMSGQNSLHAAVGLQQAASRPNHLMRSLSGLRPWCSVTVSARKHGGRDLQIYKALSRQNQLFWQTF